MAAKGGNNGESHNHNDVGSFLYLAGDEMLLTDLGAGEYTRDYFGEKRYDILCNHSFGHSVPVIDGKGRKERNMHAVILKRTAAAEPVFPLGRLMEQNV